MLNLSQFTHFSWGKIWFARFALCKRHDILQLWLSDIDGDSDFNEDTHKLRLFVLVCTLLVMVFKWHFHTKVNSLETFDFSPMKCCLVNQGASVHAQPLSTGKDELHRTLPKKCAHSEADDGLGAPLVHRVAKCHRANLSNRILPHEKILTQIYL